MNIYITLFLLFGTCFGVASFSKRHLFSEGPTRPDANGSSARLVDQFVWIVTCTFLWPLMLLTGLNSAWILARRKRRNRLVLGQADR